MQLKSSSSKMFLKPFVNNNKIVINNYCNQLLENKALFIISVMVGAIKTKSSMAKPRTKALLRHFKTLIDVVKNYSTLK